MVLECTRIFFSSIMQDSCTSSDNINYLQTYLSAIPGYMVVPPESTVLAYKSFRMSTSHFMMELYVVSWIPHDSMPRNDGWNIASGHLNRSFPIVITWLEKIMTDDLAPHQCKII